MQEQKVNFTSACKTDFSRLGCDTAMGNRAAEGKRGEALKRVMFYCQHVLGMGHLVRSTAIAKALAEKFSVRLVIGGKITRDFRFPENIDLLQLPALQSDPEFSGLMVCDSSLSLEEAKELRSRMLLDAFDTFQPDVLITELFPFGRKQFAFELIPLLERAHTRAVKPLVVSSIRDILVTKKDQPKHERRVCRTMNKFYDLVLVHGDANFLRLEETFSRVADLPCAIEYTGYVAQRKVRTAAEDVELSTNGRPMVVVSNGSGGCPAGQLLLESVLRAAAILENNIPHRFVMFAGPLMPVEAYEGLQRLAAGLPNVTLARYTPDLAGYLRRAELSISMAGYNTVMDIFSTGVRSMVFPETTNNDEEQTLRAHKLEKLGVLRMLNQEQLAPERLALEIRKGLRSQRSPLVLNVSGAENTLRVLEKHLAARSNAFAQGKHIPTFREAGWPPTQQHETFNAPEQGSICE